MEQHPVPQNITSFQFRLVGDMTLKQFGYLAGGIILAYISYKLPLPFFFTWPMTVIFGLGGFGFAFVPIEERPMDVWVLSFIKNVYNPTVFHWEYSVEKPVEPAQPVPPLDVKKSSALLTSPMASVASLFTPQKTTPSASPLPVTKPRQKSIFDSFFSWIDDFFPSAKPAVVYPSSRGVYPVVRPTPPIASVPTPMPVTPKKPDEKPKEPEVLPVDAKKTEEELSVIKLQLEAVQKELADKKLVESRVLELQKQLNDISVQKQKYEKELLTLRQSNISPPLSPFFKQTGTVTSKPSTETTVKTIGKDAAIRAGIPRLTTFPNVVTGIVKDYDSVLLPGVLVTVKDKEGIPLRALKTNKLGQFAASTPLPNGTYVVEVEDPRGRYLFDRAQVTLVGSVMPALMVIAKSKRQLDREELSKQIFGSPNANS